MDTTSLTVDPRVMKIQSYAKTAGAVVVVVVAGASLVAVAGLFMVNFVVPVTARAVALRRVQTLTKLTEKFSEETIREDEQKEAERIGVLETQYTTSRAELEGASTRSLTS